MKVLFTAHQFFPDHGAGTEVLTLGLARELAARGHETRVLAAKQSSPEGPRPGETEDYEFGGVLVRRIGRPEEGLSRPYHLNYRNPEMAEKAHECAREFRPDVVHAMHLQGLSADVVPAFKELGLPVVFTATDFWAVCPVVDLRRHDGALCTGPEPAHCVRCVASRNQNPRIGAVARATPGAAVRAAGLLARTPPARRLLPLRQVADLEARAGYVRERLNLADRVIVPTRLMRDLLHANGVGVGRTVVSGYGIDTRGISTGGRPAKENGPLRFGFIGTMSRQKGVDLLVWAFRKLPPGPDAELVLYGDPNRDAGFGEELRTLAGDDPRVRFGGTFPPEAVWDVLSGIDVLVVPSRWYENSPLIVQQALASGTPVVATDLGGLSEAVRHEGNGLLFGLDSSENLAHQMRRLRDEPGLLVRLRAGIEPVKTIQQSVDELEKLYDGLAGKSS